MSNLLEIEKLRVTFPTPVATSKWYAASPSQSAASAWASSAKAARENQ